MKPIHIALILISFLCLANHKAHAIGDRFNQKTFSAAGIAGFPQFLGLDLAYLDLGGVSPGISLGSAPINRMLNKAISLDPIPMKLGTTDTYNLYPSASYLLYSVTGYVKIFFSQNTGWFFDIMASNVALSVNVQANLKNETTESTINSVVTGSASLSQWIIGLSVGYQLPIQTNFFIEGALGVGYLPSPNYNVSLSGTATSLVSIVANGDQALSNAQSQLQSSFASAVSAFHAALQIAPMANLKIGFTF